MFVIFFFFKPLTALSVLSSLSNWASASSQTSLSRNPVLHPSSPPVAPRPVGLCPSCRRLSPFCSSASFSSLSNWASASSRARNTIIPVGSARPVGACRRSVAPLPPSSVQMDSRLWKPDSLPSTLHPTSSILSTSFILSGNLEFWESGVPALHPYCP